MLFILAHRVAEIHGLDAPAVPLELLYHVIMEVLVVDGTVGAEGRCIVIIDHGLVAVRDIIAAEVLDERRYLTLKLDIERLNHIEPTVARLSGDNPVVIGDNIILAYISTIWSPRSNLYPHIEPHIVDFFTLCVFLYCKGSTSVWIGKIM